MMSLFHSWARGQRRARRSRVAACALLCTLAWPCCVLADGYNDWSAILVEPGELWFVPALQFAPNPTPTAYAQLQFQAGISERIDFIFAAAGWIGGEQTAFDAGLLQPRIQLIEGLLFSPGVAVQGQVGGTPTSWMPGLFATLTWPSGWQVNLNSIFYLPMREPSAVDLFGVIVVQRDVSEGFALYGEIDYFGPVRAPGQAEIAGFVGMQIELGDDAINVMMTMPLSPSFEPSQLGVGLWWAHGFSFSPLPPRTFR